MFLKHSSDKPKPFCAGEEYQQEDQWQGSADEMGMSRVPNPQNLLIWLGKFGISKCPTI